MCDFRVMHMSCCTYEHCTYEREQSYIVCILEVTDSATNVTPLQNQLIEVGLIEKPLGGLEFNI